MLIGPEINDGTDSQIMLYVGISNGIAVYPIRTTNQRWKDPFRHVTFFRHAAVAENQAAKAAKRPAVQGLKCLKSKT